MSTAKPEKKHRMNVRTRRAVYGYLFISPFIIGFLVFMIRPLFTSLWFSLCSLGPDQIDAGGFHPVYNGIANYLKAFTIDPEFNRLMVDEITRILTHTLAILAISLMIAIILNQEFKGRALVRAIFFLPVILSSGVLVGLETNNSLMQSIQSAIQSNASFQLSDSVMSILRLSGLGTGILDIVADVISQVQDIVMASGIQIIVFLTGLQSIPGSLYEAADIEGCTRWESFCKITFPLISPLLIVNIIYSVIDFFMKTDNQIMDKINTTMVVNMDYGFASAMAWIYFAVVIVIIGVSSGIVSLLRGGVGTYE